MKQRLAAMQTTAQQQGAPAQGRYQDIVAPPDGGAAAPTAAQFAQLQALTAALLELREPEAIAAAVTARARAALEAQTCAVRLLSEANTPPRWAGAWRSIMAA